MRLKTYKMAMSILPKFLTLKWNISRSIWCIEVGDGCFFCICHALSFELFLIFFFYNTHTNMTYYTLQNPLPFPPLHQTEMKTNFNTKQYRTIFIMKGIHISMILCYQSVLRFTVPSKQGSEVYEFQINPF